MNRGEWNKMLYAHLPDPFPLLGSGKGLAREITSMVGWRRHPYDKASTELTAPVHALHDRLRQ